MRRINPIIPVAVAAVFLTCCATAGPGGADDVDGVDGGVTEDAAEQGDARNVNTACAAALADLSYDWEDGAQGWTHGPMPEVDPPPVSWTFDHWERGNATLGCNGGTGCWATNLDGGYVQCGRGYLRSPVMDLSACADTDVEVVFSHTYDFWVGDWDGQTWYDGGLIELTTDGINWIPALQTFPGTIRINPDMGSSYECVEPQNFHVHNKPGYIGTSGGWQEAVIPIPAHLRTTTFQLRFAYSAGVSYPTSSEGLSEENSGPGWYIDDLRIQ
jgi:hypothetical protein